MSRFISTSAQKIAGEKETYHHGDLRRALLDAARQLAEERGIDGFTLREVARRAGVSHAAPYHHFSDKTALVEALAIETYKSLAQAMKQACDRRGGNALDRLGAIGISYVIFATEHPAEFRLLTRFEVCPPPSDCQIGQLIGTFALPPLEDAANEAYHVLIRTIKEGQEAKIVAEGDVESLALTCWASVHGLAVLLLDGLIGKTPAHAQMQVSELAGIVVETLAKGLKAR
ncbi:MAG: TetR/AcrR family transcriptional regulator [Acidobacteriaceae bacterium]|nr:TetR/AcrR family transcriptional regulator [Acidobacteriaceae bacterium]MBV9227055.1 TetR/AcrR family transcriptional regulator [Acidobacteriaceae bacterium]MBV9676094.1 TetR/AcrR family transcriptional regulator [Acidobacteriaceae bacterium]